MSQPAPHSNDTPWFLRIFNSPTTLANVVAFGAALLLLYTAAWEWPKQADRFHDRLQEQREMQREMAGMQRENQRLIVRLEQLLGQQANAIVGIQKVLTDMWHKMMAEKQK